MRTNKKNLVLRIKKIWLEQIISGEKKIEYRDNSDFYDQRIGTDGDSFENVEFYCPIGSSGKILRAKYAVKKIVRSVKNNRYEIHLGRKIL